MTIQLEYEGDIDAECPLCSADLICPQCDSDELGYEHIDLPMDHAINANQIQLVEDLLTQAERTFTDSGNIGAAHYTRHILSLSKEAK